MKKNQDIFQMCVNLLQEGLCFAFHFRQRFYYDYTSEQGCNIPKKTTTHDWHEMAEIYSCKNIGSLSLKMFLNTSTDLNPVIWLPILLFSTLVIGGEALPHHRLERSISVAEWNKDYNLWQYQWGCYRAISSRFGAKFEVLCAELLSHYWTLTGPNFKVPKNHLKL